MRGQLNKLRASRHPKTGQVLPQATYPDGTPVEGVGRYSRLDEGSKVEDSKWWSEVEQMMEGDPVVVEQAVPAQAVPAQAVVTPMFVPYIPRVPKQLRPVVGGKFASVKMAEKA